MKSLRARALARLARRALCFGLLLFGPAGSFDFWQGWTCLGVFFGSEMLIVRHLLRTDPVLLDRRLRGGPFAEQRLRQKVLISLLTACFVSTLLVSGYDRRFGWSHVSAWLAIVADAGVAAGFFLQFQAFKANSFAAAIVATMPEQRLIATGPYAAVRHPMYSGSLVLCFCLSLALGSWWGLACAVGTLGAILLRLSDEEKMLLQRLPGYADYCRQVPYRLLRHVW